MTKSKKLLTTLELCSRIKYSPEIITNKFKDKYFLEGVHYTLHPVSGDVRYDWEAIKKDKNKFAEQGINIPVATGYRSPTSANYQKWQNFA